MQRILVLASVLGLVESQRFAVTETPSVQGFIPRCVDGEAAANTLQCHLWSYDPIQDTCSTMPMTLLPLIFGITGSFDVELEYIYQPGFPLQTYLDNFLCIWNVTAPEDPCIFVEYSTLFKDFHATDPFDGAVCDSRDHVQIRYGVNQFEHHCGNQLADNCPFGNCITTRILSEEPMTATFRSDNSGSSLGFYGLFALHTKDSCLKRRKRQQQQGVRYGIIEVPKTSLCQVMNCACDGSCTQPAAGIDAKSYTEEERQAAKDIITDKNGATAYAYANSANQFLLRVARRAILNVNQYGTTLPTVTQRLRC